jgi:hypothetical protein
MNQNKYSQYKKQQTQLNKWRLELSKLIGRERRLEELFTETIRKRNEIYLLATKFQPYQSREQAKICFYNKLAHGKHLLRIHQTLLEITQKLFYLQEEQGRLKNQIQNEICKFQTKPHPMDNSNDATRCNPRVIRKDCYSSRRYHL